MPGPGLAAATPMESVTVSVADLLMLMGAARTACSTRPATLSPSVIAALPLFLRPDRRDVFPSIAMTPSGIPVIDATHAAKQLWNCPASSTARMSPR